MSNLVVRKNRGVFSGFLYSLSGKCLLAGMLVFYIEKIYTVAIL